MDILPRVGLDLYRDECHGECQRCQLLLQKNKKKKPPGRSSSIFAGHCAHHPVSLQEILHLLANTVDRLVIKPRLDGRTEEEGSKKKIMVSRGNLPAIWS